MEKHRNRNNDNFDTLYDFAPCGLILFEINGLIIHANQTLLSWLEISLEDIVQLKFTDFLDKGGVLYYEVFVRPLLNMDSVVNEINFQIIYKKATFPCLFNAKLNLVKTYDREIVEACIFKMYNRKRYEYELLQQKITAEKEQKIILERFIFSQSHLIRAPLTNVMGLISLLKSNNLTKQVKEIANMLETSALNIDIELKKIIKKVEETLNKVE